MRHTAIGAYEAKTKLSALLDRVAHGEAFVLTRRGRPVAVLEPLPRSSAQEDDPFTAIDAFARRHRASGLVMRDLVLEGRSR